MIDQYFFLLEKINFTASYTKKEIALFKLNLWQVSRESKQIDFKLTNYYEETKLRNNNKLPTVGEMGRGRTLRSLGDHSNAIRYIDLHINSINDEN